jgi:hypothetical protein
MTVFAKVLLMLTNQIVVFLSETATCPHARIASITHHIASSLFEEVFQLAMVRFAESSSLGRDCTGECVLSIFHTNSLMQPFLSLLLHTSTKLHSRIQAHILKRLLLVLQVRLANAPRLTCCFENISFVRLSPS